MVYIKIFSALRLKTQGTSLNVLTLIKTCIIQYCLAPPPPVDSIQAIIELLTHLTPQKPSSEVQQDPIRFGIISRLRGYSRQEISKT